jgi:hypothetical protein
VTSKIVLVLLALTWMGSASADKWLPAQPQVFESRRATYRLTVFPAQPATAQLRCEAVLERLAEDQRHYEQVWRKPLVNELAPVSALVSEADGSFVTFDNWGSKGYGDDAIVIYSGAGTLRKKFALTDLMSDADFKRLPSSASSVHWGGPHELSHNERTLNVQIVAVEGLSVGESVEGNVEQEGEFRTVRIDMNSGKVLATASP